MLFRVMPTLKINDNFIVFNISCFGFCKHMLMWFCTYEDRTSIDKVKTSTNDHGVTSCRDSMIDSMDSPSSYTYTRLLQDCIHKKSLIEGKLVHAHMIKNGIQPDIFLRNSLINMYAKCDDLVGAKNEFDNLIERDQVSWNAIIAAYARQGELKAAVELLRQMGRESKKADHYTFGSILVACSNLRVPKLGKQLHTHSIKTGFELHVSVGCSLVNMYAKCNSVEDARQVFDKMPERNVVSWTAMITGYALQECGDEAMEVFELMQWTDVGLNKFIFTSVLSAFAHPRALEQGEQIHVHAIKHGLEMDVSVGNALVTMYANCGSIDDALQAFRLASKHDLVSWNAIITGYAQNVHGEKALCFFCEMQCSGLKPNQFTFVSVLKACAIEEALEQGKQIHSSILKLGFGAQIFVGSALVDMYAKCGSIEEAHRGFDEMPDKDMVSWTALIAGYMRNGNGEEVMSLFCQMEHAGIKPNQYTLTCVLSACASLAGLEQGKQVHGHIYKIGLDLDVSVGSALTTMYAKGGSIDDAWAVFDKMPTRDVVSWNSIIAGYSQHGRGMEALQLFGHMQQTGTKPDDITFINVLSACSHGGLVDQGWQYFNYMIHDHNIIPRIDHYGCMVDILGRGGYLEKAEDFIKNASFDHKAPLWRILLGACRTHGKVEIAKRAAEYILELEAHDSTTYVLLSNTYAAAGRWSDVEKVRKLMKDKGMKKEPGRSWIQVGNRVHVFVVGDRSHPQTNDIYAILENLTKVLKDAGYVPDTKSVLHDLDQEKKCYNPISG